LKTALAEARKQDRIHPQNGNTPRPGKPNNTAKYLKIGAAVLTTGISVAGCVINPMMVPHAVTAFVHLANAFFDSPSTDSGGYSDTADINGYTDSYTEASYDYSC
jgi:hypothetical protein